jgi:hypothetical protein
MGGRIALSSHNGRSQQYPSSISEDAKDVDSESTTIDSILASTTRTTPDEFESVSRTEHQLCPDVVDEANQDWEVRKIIGREHVEGVLHYLVEWCPTLEPEHSLGHAKELVDEFEARLQALRNNKEGRMGPAVKRDGHAVVGADVSGGQEKKRQRGRPRKHK